MADLQIANSSPMPAGVAVIVYLHSPREKIWGLLHDLSSAGVFVRGIDLNAFDDWIQMVVLGERNLGLSHVFLPMWRVERVSLDETIDDIQSLADRFASRVGLSVAEYLAYRATTAATEAPDLSS